MTAMLFPEIEAERQRLDAEERATEQRYRDHEAEFTPRGVVRPLVAVTMPRVIEIWRWSIEHGYRNDDALRVLGLCSGPGVWESEVLRWCVEHGITVHITGVEIREEEREHLQRSTHEVIIDDWHVGLGMEQDERGVWSWPHDRARPRYDLTITNPAFKQARAPLRPGWPRARRDANGRAIKSPADDAIRRAMTADAIAEGKHPELAQYAPEASMPVLALGVSEFFAAYGTTQGWIKTAAGWLVRELRPYSYVHDVPGAIGHRGRGGKGSDQVSYSLFTWDRSAPCSTVTTAIDPIPGEDRNWTLRPGTEPPEWLRANGIPYLETVDGERVLVNP